MGTTVGGCMRSVAPPVMPQQTVSRCNKRAADESNANANATSCQPTPLVLTSDCKRANKGDGLRTIFAQDELLKVGHPQLQQLPAQPAFSNTTAKETSRCSPASHSAHGQALNTRPDPAASSSAIPRPQSSGQSQRISASQDSVRRNANKTCKSTQSAEATAATATAATTGTREVITPHDEVLQSQASIQIMPLQLQQISNTATKQSGSTLGKRSRTALHAATAAAAGAEAQSTPLHPVSCQLGFSPIPFKAWTHLPFLAWSMFRACFQLHVMSFRIPCQCGVFEWMSRSHLQRDSGLSRSVFAHVYRF